LNATSPPDEDWPVDPEGVLRRVMPDYGAEYIEESLVFSHNGKLAQALFKTEEASDGRSGTDFYGLARRLDGIDVTLYISTEVWLERRREQESVASS
jgi:hypothetical protein